MKVQPIMNMALCKYLYFGHELQVSNKAGSGTSVSRITRINLTVGRDIGLSLARGNMLVPIFYVGNRNTDAQFFSRSRGDDIESIHGTIKYQSTK